MNRFAVENQISDALRRAGAFNNTTEWDKDNIEYETPVIEFVFDSVSQKMYVTIVVKEY